MKIHVLAATALLLAGGLLLGLANPAQAAHGELNAPVVKLGGFTVKLEPVAGGFNAPNWGVNAPGLPGYLFVSDQTGILYAVDLATGDKQAFLDVSGLLVELGALPQFLIEMGFPQFDERGLLGFAFHPEFESNGLLYTYTSQPATGAADYSTIPAGGAADHQSVLTEWKANDPGDPSAGVDPASARELLRVDEPQFNHDGGSMAFGPDGLLYITLSDGGGQDDKDAPWPPFADIIGHGDTGNGQNIQNPLGSILRIDPTGSGSANGAYGIPADNPFTATVGCSDGCDEIYAYGFRNPFRMSFDSATGDLYAGDVGQNDVEEVDVVVKGGNYGWNRKEGSFFFNTNDDPEPMNGFSNLEDPGDVPADVIDPIAEYNNNIPADVGGDGHAIIGGFVYRGSAIPDLKGRYVFGDFSLKFLFSDGPQGCLIAADPCPLKERIIGAEGRLFYLSKKNVVKSNGRTKKSKIKEFKLEGKEAFGMALLGFGQDADGELYVMANATGTPLSTTGVVMKIVRAGK